MPRLVAKGFADVWPVIAGLGLVAVAAASGTPSEQDKADSKYYQWKVNPEKMKNGGGHH